MSRNYGVQRFERHKFQPVYWRMRRDDILAAIVATPLRRVALAVGIVAMILLGMSLSARADDWSRSNPNYSNTQTGTVRVAKVRAQYPARRHMRSPRAVPVLDANGNGVKVCASGHRMCVSVAASARPTLQCVVDHIEAAGVRITALGGIRRGHCSTRSMHPCGKALDVNQTARDVNGPPRSVSSAAATACGAVSGSWWAGNPDNGHFQVGGWAGTHGSTITASAHRRHHRHHRRLARLQ